MKKLAFLFFLCVGTAAAQDSPFQFAPVFSGSGRPLPGATISICVHVAVGSPCTNFATVFSDQARTQQINQATSPIKTDSFGNVPVTYAAPGLYDYTISGAGISTLGPYSITISCTPGVSCVAQNGPVNATSLNVSGTGTFTGTTPATGLNACIVNGVFYVGNTNVSCWAGSDFGTQFNNAASAISAGGAIQIPPGSLAPATTISITKALTVQGASTGATTITPTAAVTGSAISINPGVAAQVILRHINLNMVNVPTITGIAVNNLAPNSELSYILINLGSIGIDITNTGVSKFQRLFITNQSSYGIRDNADGGAEHHFDDVWLINNNNTVNTANALFAYLRTTSTDTGGLYMNQVRTIQNAAGGVVTNGIAISSTAGSRSILHAFLTDTICDGITGGDCVLFNNVQRITVMGGQWSDAKSNQSCAAATVSCFAGVSLVGTAQVEFSPSTVLISNNRDISFSGAVDLSYLNQTRLYGSAASGAAHIWVVTGATLTNLLISDPDFAVGTVYSNNETSLLGAVPTMHTYLANGKVGFPAGAAATPGLCIYSADTCTTGFWAASSGTWGFSSNGGITNKIGGAAMESKLFTADIGPALATVTPGAGWGTGASIAPCTTRTGQVNKFCFVITSGSAAFAAAPTLTVTLPTALLSTTTVCELNVHGITGAGGAIMFDETTLSTTAPVFTAVTSTGAAFTPAVTETYTVVGSCGP